MTTSSVKTPPQPYQVPRGLAIMSSWAWRLALIGFVTLALLFLAKTFILIILPFFIALLLSSLGLPVVDFLERKKVPRSIGALLVLLIGLGLLSLLTYFVIQQVIANSDELSRQLADGLEQIRLWLANGPLKLTDSQINSYLTQAQKFIQTEPEKYIEKATELGFLAFELIAGFFVMLFAGYFFLKDARVLGRGAARIFPKDAEAQALGAMRAIWLTLSKYTKATLVVSLVNSTGVMILAKILGLPLIIPMGIIVFLTSFIPIVGILLAGMLTVLVALVAQGPVVAVIMLTGVIIAHEIEAHLLQPLIMGKFVALHPLAVLTAVMAGLLVGGVPGALIAVPLAATVKVTALYLTNELPEDENQEEELKEVQEVQN